MSTIDKEKFQFVKRDDFASETIDAPAYSYWGSVFRQFLKKKSTVIMLGILVAIILMSFIYPMFSDFDFNDVSKVNDFSARFIKPNAEHWFGTDTLGRDLYVRVVYGARISLVVGFVAAAINLVIGVIYGSVAGFFGGKVDRLMMGFVDILYGIPLLLYVILLMVVLSPGLTSIFIALGIAYWLTMARIVRSQIVTLKNEEYVLAARSMGVPAWRILFRHMLPNCVGPIIITMTLAIPEAIFTEAFLSFIGLGVNAPMASWGVLAAEGINSMRSYPFQLIAPALAIGITMLGFTFFGDGLRNALDPKGEVKR